jgi:putative transposase
VNLLQRHGSNLLVRYIEWLRASVQAVRHLHPFHIHGWVVLPDHLHCVIELPDGDADYRDALASDQVGVLKEIAEYRTAVPGTHCPPGAGHLAATVLGTSRA